MLPAVPPAAVQLLMRQPLSMLQPLSRQQQLLPGWWWRGWWWLGWLGWLWGLPALRSRTAGRKESGWVGAGIISGPTHAE